MDGWNALISGGPWPVEEKKKALGRKPYANYCIELLTNLVTMLLRLLYETRGHRRAGPDDGTMARGYCTS